MQEKLALLGCVTVYGQVPELVVKLLGVQVNQSQVYRICQKLSQALPSDELQEASQPLAAKQAQPESLLYGMVDGSLLFTDLGWQETKLGRVFAQPPDGEPVALDEPSEYVAYRGHYSGFTVAFERLLPPQSPAQKVFITDGAEWIARWLSDSYADATHILDYFHVVEKLAQAVSGRPNSRQWVKKQEGYLLTNQSQQVEENLSRLTHLPAQQRRQLVGYLMKNRHRMRYGDYRQRGLLIGSGPIEAAHRTVLQVRMKRSGQRWADTGADNMIRLRVAYKSNKFHLVSKLLLNP